MTNQELKDRIAALLSGHEEATAETDFYYEKVNAALEQVNALRPMEICHRLVHRPVLPISVCDIHHDEGVDDVITGSGVVGFSFRVFGLDRPSVVITTVLNEGDDPVVLASMTDGGDWSTFYGTTAITTAIIDGHVEHRLKFSVPRDVTITFAGGYYNAEGVGLYPYAVDRQQIYSPYLEYDIRKQIGERFLAFASSPVREGERALYLGRDYLMSDGSVSFPFAKSGTYDIYIRLKPGKFTGADDNEVQIAPDLEGLVPYLAAYIILLPDDPEYASYLKRRYDEMLQSIDRHTVRAEGYANVTGWGV